MLQFFKQESGDKKQYPKIDKPGRYVGEVVKVEQFHNKEHPDWKPGLRFLFRVLEEPFVGSFASGLVTPFWKIGNALDNWCSAMGINGAELTETMTEDVFKKRRVVLGIEINDKGYPTVKALYVMRPEDQARITTTPNQSVAASPAPAVISPIQQAQPQVIKKPPVVSPGVVTQDDSLPF